MDYLSKIRNAKSLHKIAMYMRAQGCRICADLGNFWTESERFIELRKVEEHAQFIETNCKSLANARDLLYAWGYLQKIPKSPLRKHPLEDGWKRGL
jgi:hypothetical protein